MFGVWSTNKIFFEKSNFYGKRRTATSLICITRDMLCYGRHIYDSNLYYIAPYRTVRLMANFAAEDKPITMWDEHKIDRINVAISSTVKDIR